MRKKRDTDLRSELILAGIDEINTYGANDFSVSPGTFGTYGVSSIFGTAIKSGA